MDDYKINIEWSPATETYSVAVNDETVLECLSFSEVRQLKIGDVIRFYEEV